MLNSKNITIINNQGILNIYPETLIIEYRRYNPRRPQQKQQALQLYSQYLDTIFPTSKVKEIVYHGSNQKINQFEIYYLSLRLP